MIKVSVIIPVYNTAPYLTRCLDSVCDQTLTDIEILCINDGSTDRSLEILRDYEGRDSRVRVISFEQNKGVSVARNTGIDAAQGEYIGFVDSDDYVDLDFYEKLYTEVNGNGVEIVKGLELKIIHPDGSISVDKHNDKIRKNKIHFWTEYTSAIFNRQFIQRNNIYFPEGLLVGEDPCFTLKASILSKSIRVIESAQYYYVRRVNSLNSDIWNKEKIQSYIKYIDYVANFAEKADLSRGDYKILFKWLLEDAQNTCKNKAGSNKNYQNLFEPLFRKLKCMVGIDLLFDATIFHGIESKTDARSGIFFVAYNILKQLSKNSQINITLYLEYFNAVLREACKKDDLLKKFDILCLKYKSSVKNTGYIKNPKFCPDSFDAYINVSCFSLLCGDDMDRIVKFYVLHDTTLLLLDYGDEGWRKNRKAFWNFYDDSLTKNTYGFCVSESARRDFLRFFPVLDPAKMIVTPIATARKFKPNRDIDKLNEIKMKYNMSALDTYIFSFNSYNLRKGLIFTVGCYLKFIERHRINNLCFLSAGGGDVSYYKKKIEQNYGELFHRYKNRIFMIGYIDDEDLEILYSHALFTSYLSEYEGFGMPPLEAMSCGIPVITSNTSSLPEVVGDAAVTIDPYDDEACIKAFEDLYFDNIIRKEYIAKGFVRAKIFTWEKTVNVMADKMMRVLDTV
ncbi:MAG: glycosyltransferase [Spirochaetaceae bacterium]|jgi:glycosyltransferase involved in cell wall biosynthesis|nr:glycosyltransferase [Spirochaetaceae bacterium]